MANVKHTKNELKAQKEALARYERFLPMLQLKKQQLQAEIHSIEAQIAAKESAEKDLRTDLERWVGLLSGPADLEKLVVLESVRLGSGNIAGVSIPVLGGAEIARAEIDLFLTAQWLDDAAETVAALVVLRVEKEVLAEQKRRVQKELRTTSQRVNLFEKVKIPECRENIRVIKIFLGDEQTAGVVRGKIAKGRAPDAADERRAA